MLENERAKPDTFFKTSIKQSVPLSSRMCPPKSGSQPIQYENWHNSHRSHNNRRSSTVEKKHTHRKSQNAKPRKETVERKKATKDRRPSSFRDRVARVLQEIGIQRRCNKPRRSARKNYYRELNLIASHPRII